MPVTTKSVEYWDEQRKKRRIGFIKLDRDMYNSDAYLALSATERDVLLMVLNQLIYEKSRGKKRRQKRKSVMKIIDIFLPHNLLESRGIRSNSTRTNARKRLVEVGFLDVVETGSVHHASVFRLSQRWREYPNGDYKPKDSRPPGRCLYQDKTLKNPDHPINRMRNIREESAIQELNVKSLRFSNVTNPMCEYA